MKVNIKGEPTELFVQTITLQPEEGNNLYGFHCLTCGNFHQKIGGKVSKIYPIYEPSDQVPTVSKCRNCGSEYTFQTYDGYSNEEIRVVLHSRIEKVTNHFFCYRGKDLLLDYTSEEIYSPVENRSKKPPFTMHCSNSTCTLTYLISDIF